MAFTVADEYQNRGAATLLLRELVASLATRGIREFVAHMLDDNRRCSRYFSARNCRYGRPASTASAAWS